jgi:plastocyanin
MVVSDPATIGTYIPSPAEVRVGATVEWRFVDQNPHTVSADDSSFDSTPRSRGKTFTHTFTSAGTVNYHCSIHPEMHGTVVVGNA